MMEASADSLLAPRRRGKRETIDSLHLSSRPTCSWKRGQRPPPVHLEQTKQKPKQRPKCSFFLEETGSTYIDALYRFDSRCIYLSRLGEWAPSWWFQVVLVRTGRLSFLVSRLQSNAWRRDLIGGQSDAIFVLLISLCFISSVKIIEMMMSVHRYLKECTAKK